MINILEEKNIYGTVDTIKKIEHFISKRFCGVLLRKHSYTETFFEEDEVDGAAKKKHIIGFNKSSLPKVST